MQEVEDVGHSQTSSGNGSYNYPTGLPEVEEKVPTRTWWPQPRKVLSCEHLKVHCHVKRCPTGLPEVEERYLSEVDGHDQGKYFH